MTPITLLNALILSMLLWGLIFWAVRGFLG